MLKFRIGSDSAASLFIYFIYVFTHTEQAAIYFYTGYQSKFGRLSQFKDNVLAKRFNCCHRTPQHYKVISLP